MDPDHGRVQFAAAVGDALERVLPVLAEHVDDPQQQHPAHAEQGDLPSQPEAAAKTLTNPEHDRAHSRG
ncbi:hypothetical protein GCM10007888_25170 [Methylobacterium oxalidis]|uniref:Uncharacterized protein n=1 Tax=Methylobacterium oxalidis TaxID=944322 RepID=A0ABQ6DL31_9HYPH|nr:hypothetical protein GCM10007888_25170 [Methylobacterium oxalidis]